MADTLYLGIYRFSGVPYHRWLFTANKKSAMFAAQGIASRRNVDVPTERTELVQLFEIGTEITKQRADEYVEQMRRMRDKMKAPHPEDIDKDAPDYMLHRPVTESGRAAAAALALVRGGRLWPGGFRI